MSVEEDARLEQLLTIYDGDTLAAQVLLDKYLLPTELAPDDMWKRIAYAIAGTGAILRGENIEDNFNDYYKLLKDWAFIPGGRIMYAAGRDKKVTTSNCYFLAIKEDSIEGIYDWLKESAIVYKTGGGCGVDISILRPAGTPVKNSGGVSPGAHTFLDLMSKSTQTVHQKNRRGALLVSMDVRHPDIESFITIKNTPGLVEHANLSVKITDEFMNCVESNSKFELRWPVDSVNPVIRKKVSAKKLWNQIIKNAHGFAEPGILFVDNFKKNDNLHYFNSFQGTNPCVAGDTKVSTNIGEVDVITLMDLIKKGYNIKAFSFYENRKDDGFVELKPILDAFKTKKNSEIIELTLEFNGDCYPETEKFKLTPDHLVWVRGKGYIPAVCISETDELITGNLSNCRVINKRAVPNEDVYDIVVEDNHNFFANGVLVHNCGEQGLGNYSNCNLGHLNLSYFAENGVFNTVKFQEYIEIAVRFMDDVIDYNDGNHALKEQNEIALQERRIGIGFTGLADALLKMKIKYDSEAAIEIVREITNILKIHSYSASINIAKTRGSFPALVKDEFVKSEFVSRLFEENVDLKREFYNNGIRNSYLLTVAPVGSGSIVSRLSGFGMEPIFATSYQRRVRNKKDDGFNTFTVYPKIITDLFKDPNDLPDYIVTSHDIDPFFRVKLQSVVQSNTDNSISSTCNLPSDTTEEVIDQIYTNAWKMGLKGITVYRDGSREGILIKDAKPEPEKIIDNRLKNKKRPITVQGRTYKIPSGPEEKLYITINPSPEDPKRPYEVFISTFGSDNPQLQTITVLLSALLKNINNGPDFIIEDLKKIESSQSPVFWHDVEAGRRYSINSVPRAVSIALEKFMNQVNGRESNREEEEIIKEERTTNARACPKCFALSYISENGCEHCLSCGYQKCG